MNKLKIRAFAKQDFAQVIKLWSRCNLIVPSNNPEKDIKRKLQENPELFFVGEINRQIVSTCMAGYDGHRGWIYYLAVNPEFQRKGIASELVKYAELKLKDLGCPKINLMIRNTNTGMIEFYKKIGYSDDPVFALSKRLQKDKPFKNP